MIFSELIIRIPYFITFFYQNQLKKQKIGKVSGGGTVINLETKMIYCCDIDIDLLDVRYIDELICIIKDLNLKEKHSLIYDKKEISFN